MYSTWAMQKHHQLFGELNNYLVISADPPPARLLATPTVAGSMGVRTASGHLLFIFFRTFAK
jgi:hypothetical protein